MTQVHSAMVDDALEATLLKLLAYCDANGWAGFDPYDALNSRVFEALPFLNSRLPRLVLTQAEEHTSELQSTCNLVCRVLLEKKKQTPFMDPAIYTWGAPAFKVGMLHSY